MKSTDSRLTVRDPDREILCIADDLTGALEVGAKFADLGIPAVVTTGEFAAACDAAVRVVDTESRHLPASQAHAVVHRIVQPHNSWLIYKKTDSTLRGNIAAEFQALLDAFPERYIYYCPAYPEMGRTVRNGCLYVDGVPLHQTAFARDSLNPIRTCEVAAILNGVPALIIDAESSNDVRTAAIVASTGAPAIAAGPAALAAALAEFLHHPRQPSPSLPRIDSCLIVNGSLHPTSLAQIEFAKQNACFDSGWDYFESTSTAAGLERAAQTGTLIANLRDSYQAIIVFGGDTAFGIHRAFGSGPFESLGEIVPGVPLSRSNGIYWITKAGGFGPPSILCDIRRRLT